MACCASPPARSQSKPVAIHHAKSTVPLPAATATGTGCVDNQNARAIVNVSCPVTQNARHQKQHRVAPPPSGCGFAFRTRAHTANAHAHAHNSTRARVKPPTIPRTSALLPHQIQRWRRGHAVRQQLKQELQGILLGDARRSLHEFEQQRSASTETFVELVRSIHATNRTASDVVHAARHLHSCLGDGRKCHHFTDPFCFFPGFPTHAYVHNSRQSRCDCQAAWPDSGPPCSIREHSESRARSTSWAQSTSK